MHVDDAATVRKAIIAGLYDNELESLLVACTERRKLMGHQLFAELQVGDKVRMTGGKQYLIGAVGTVVDKKVSKITVEFPEDMPFEHDPYGKWAGHRAVCPPSILEKVT